MVLTFKVGDTRTRSTAAGRPSATPPAARRGRSSALTRGDAAEEHAAEVGRSRCAVNKPGQGTLMPLLPLAEVTLSYGCAGTHGPRVLMVQGVGCVGEGWRPQIEDLARDHQVAWLDNRGIGGSLPLSGAVTIEAMARDCQHLIRHLGWDRVHLVGHSMGGVIVQQVARDMPAHTASLTLMSTVRRGRDASIPSLASIVVSLRTRFGSDRARWLKAAALPFPPAYRATLPDDEQLRLMQMIFCRDFLSTPAIVRKQVAALWAHRGGDMAGLMSTPTLIVTGAQDIVVHTRHSDDLKAQLPQARLQRLADAGHGVPLQHAAAVNQLLRDHFRGASGDVAAPRA